MVANSEVSPFWSYFLVGGYSTGTRKSSTGRSMSASAMMRHSRIISDDKRVSVPITVACQPRHERGAGAAASFDQRCGKVPVSSVSAFSFRSDSRSFEEPSAER